MYGLLLEDRDVWVITRGQRCMGYYQRIEMYGLLLEDRNVWLLLEDRDICATSRG